MRQFVCTQARKPILSSVGFMDLLLALDGVSNVAEFPTIFFELKAVPSL
jgi:hypothetical protein